jgi:hypothetical protein
MKAAMTTINFGQYNNATNKMVKVIFYFDTGENSESAYWWHDITDFF